MTPFANGRYVYSDFHTKLAAHVTPNAAMVQANLLRHIVFCGYSVSEMDLRNLTKDRVASTYVGVCTTRNRSGDDIDPLTPLEVRGGVYGVRAGA